MYLTVESRSSGDMSRFLTSNDLEKFKQDARKLKREQKIPHHEALEQVAHRARFDNWHQVAEADKAMQPTERAVQDGVVVAMDLKEAMEHGSNAIELGDGRGRFVSDPLLPEFYRDTFYEIELNGIDEEDGKPNKEKWTEEEILGLTQELLDDMMFYRFAGDNPPLAPETVVELVAKAAFWGPQFVWIKKKMHDTYSLPSDSEHGYVRL